MPNQCVTIEAAINLRTQTNTTGIIHPTEQYSGDNQIAVASAFSTVPNSKIEVRVTNTSQTPFTLKKNATVAEVPILSPQQAKQLQPLNSAALKVLTDDNSNQTLIYVNELLKSAEITQKNETSSETLRKIIITSKTTKGETLPVSQSLYTTKRSTPTAARPIYVQVV